jgi:hypothetical protein
MSHSQIAYVGPPELRDAHIVAVERAGDRARVRVRGVDGRSLALEFIGVTGIFAAHPEGMLVHGLAELRGDADAPMRQFIFANSEEWDDAGLEIAADDFWVLKDGKERPEEPEGRR